MLQLPGGLDEDFERQDKFDAIAEAMPGFGGRGVEVRFGTASGSWPGGTPAASNTPVSHGLGRVPVAVVATVLSAPSGTWFPVLAAFTYTSTSFLVTAVTSDGSSPAAATGYAVAWIAIG